MDRRQFHKTVVAGAAVAMGVSGGGQASAATPAGGLPPHPGDALPAGATTRLGTTRFWYQEKCGNPGLNDLAFSPDGRVLAALGYDDCMISLWEVPSGRMLREWRADEADRRGELVFSPCGRYLAQAGYEGLSLWDPHTGRLVRRLADHREPHFPFIFGVAFSPDSTLVAGAVWYAGAVVLWETATGRPVARFEADPQPVWPDNPWGERSDFFTCVAFSADGRRLAVGGSYKVFLDREGPEAEQVRQRRCQYGGSYSITGVGAMDPKSFVDHRGRVRCWEVASGRQVAKLDGHTFRVGKVGFLRDGRLVSCAIDGEVWVWDVAAGRQVSELAPSARRLPGGSLAFAGDGRHAALTRRVYLGLIDLTDGREVQQFPLTPSWTGWGPVAVSPDARWVVTNEGGRLVLWDATTGAESSPPARHATEWVDAVSFTRDGRVATATAEDAILWDAATGELLGRVQDCRHLLAHTLALSPDGNRAAAVRRFSDGVGVPRRDCLATWDWDTCEVRTWEHTEVAAVAWSPDGESLYLVGKEGDLDVLDLRTGLLDRPWDGPPADVRAVAVSPDGQFVAALDVTPSVHIRERSPGGWHREFNLSAASCEPTGLGDMGPSLLFSPDSRRLALATSGGAICLGPVDGPELPLAFTTPPPSEVFGSSFAMGFLPSGRLLVARSYIPGDEEHPGPETIRVFDVEAGRQVWESPTLASHPGALAFSPDGRRLASGLTDGTTLLWDLGGKAGVLPEHRGPAKNSPAHPLTP